MCLEHPLLVGHALLLIGMRVHDLHCLPQEAHHEGAELPENIKSDVLYVDGMSSAMAQQSTGGSQSSLLFLVTT
jgi:hypothetical protein